MRIGPFFDNQTNERVTYSYCRRGMEKPYHPDRRTEDELLDVYDKENGALFYGQTVSWRGEELLDNGIDLCVDFSEKIFADHVMLVQENGSKVKSIELFTKKGKDYVKIGSYAGEGDRNISTKDIRIPVGYYCDNIVIRINGAYENFGIEKLDVLGMCELETKIYPQPENCEISDDVLLINSGDFISAIGEDAQFAAEYFAEKFREKFSISFEVNKDAGKIELCVSEIENDGFEIEVNKNMCRITAGGRRGFLYAMDTLISLSDGKTIKCVKISDKPFMNFRGVHMALPSRENTELLKRIIKYVLVPMRYNTLFLQISGAMRYDNYPEINEAWLKSCEKFEKGEGPKPAHYKFVSRDIWEKSEVADLCEYIRSFGMEIIPEIQSWGHTQYITTAYPELAEKVDEKAEEEDLYSADERPAQVYPHCMCPSHPKYYDYIFGVAEEVLDVIKPERFVHMGHDEIYYMALCKKCKSRGAAKLYAEEVTKLNDFVKSHGLTMMLWSDMIQEKSGYKSVRAINHIPRDIVMLDFIWYFHPENDIEDNLLSHGFRVVFGNMYSSHFPRYEHRARKDGIFGAEVSTWVECTEESYALEGKLFDFVYSANMMWSEGYRSDMRLTYNELIKPLIWEMRQRIGELPLEKESQALSFAKRPSNLVPKDALCCSNENPVCEISVESHEGMIGVLHATDKNAERRMWEEAQKVGEYIFVYEDGKSFTSDILYGINILCYNRTYAMPISSFLFRHEGYIGTYYTKPECGKTADGADYTLYEHYMKNPYPEKKISKLLLKKKEDTDVSILLFEVKCFN